MRKGGRWRASVLVVGCASLLLLLLHIEQLVIVSLARAFEFFVDEKRDHQALLADEDEHERHDHVEMGRVLEGGLARVVHKL